MAKTESTAVNQLIELVQTATPLQPDPSEDLMFKAPDKKPSRMVMSATVPSIKTEVPALPRTRAPQGTQQSAPITDAPRPPVRMSTAARPVTMPSTNWAAEGTGENDVVTDVKNQAVAVTPPPVPPSPKAQPSLPPPVPRASVRADPRPSAVLRTEAPATMPVAAPFEPVPVAAAPVIAAPVAAPPAPEMIHGYPSAAPYLAHVPADMTSHQPWFDEQPSAPVEVEIDVDLGTDRVRQKATDWKALIPKLIAPTLGLCIVGMFVGGYLAFDGQGGKSRAAVASKEASQPETKVAIKATIPAPAPAAAPTVIDDSAKPQPVIPEVAATTPPNEAPHATRALAETTAAPAVVVPAVGRSALVDVRLDSTPSGATVTLIDRGKSTFLGSTPLSTSLDPSRKYDLVFSHTSKPTQIEHLDPSTTKRLSVVLGKSPKATAQVTAQIPKTEAPRTISPSKTETPKQAEAPKAPKKLETQPVTKTEAPSKTEEPKRSVVDPFEAAPKGDGMLMVSSKPPCEILVDGVATGLTTPQRAIKLPAGNHKITLLNTAEKIKKTVTITITADQPTKVIENFMK